MRIVTPAEAVAGIRSGNQVYVQCAAAVPTVLLDALVARAPDLRDVGMVHLHTEGPGPHLAPEMAGALPPPGPLRRPQRAGGRQRGPGRLRAGLPVGRAHGSSSRAPSRWTWSFVNVTPPDKHGFCSLNVSVEAMHAAIRAATTVIAQLNPALPRTLGESFIHVDDIDLAVEVDIPPFERPDRADRRPSSGGSASTSRSSSPTARPCSSGSAPSRRRRRWRSDGPPRPRRPHRDVHRQHRGPRGGRRRSPARARSATGTRSSPRS